MLEYHLQSFYAVLVTINVTLTLVVLLAACLCCKRKVPKNDMLGLEGMVKLKNPDEVIVVTTTIGQSESQAELNMSTVSNGDSDKRASVAAHRSLPDIPVADADNGSELYETVADKRLMDTLQSEQNKSPITSLKKQASVSQHSSISQADDLSSPYSRVKNSPHDYAKVRTTEHPYAQLNAPSTSGGASTANSNRQSGSISETLNRNSHNSETSQSGTDVVAQAEIPAASAIAGMISASQDLPYMTPPIATQHFSGDSQDSSKGYTSISVREPLANILAQQPPKSVNRTIPLSRDTNDSHYATVSDDSDETYAAIEDPNGRPNPNADIYTSGSETYAQIQPQPQPQSMQSNAIVVSVEINNSAEVNVITHPAELVMANAQASVEPTTAILNHNHNQVRPNSEHILSVAGMQPVDSLRAQMHSRQASSSSNNSSSIGNIGSPKPEKRQANSPLPPTPKSTASHQLSTTSSSSLASGRNSVISVIECGNIVEPMASMAPTALPEDSPQHKSASISPTKDIEGMYAKVMKKSKFSRNSPTSQDSSPVLSRKHSEQAAGTHAQLGVSPLDSAAAKLMETHKLTITTSGGSGSGSGSGNGNSGGGGGGSLGGVVGQTVGINSIDIENAADKIRIRSNSYGVKDHGYETIPADGLRSDGIASANRKSDCYAHILQKERLQEGAKYTMVNPTASRDSPTLERHSDEKHYETIAGPDSMQRNDPGYETLQKPDRAMGSNSIQANTIIRTIGEDPNYEVLKEPEIFSGNVAVVSNAGLSDDGYAKVIEKKSYAIIDEDSTDGYSKVRGEENEDAHIAGYSTIGEIKTVLSIGADANHNYASILETKTINVTTPSSNESEHDDHYAHIAEARTTTIVALPLSNVSMPATKSDETLSPRPINSPSSSSMNSCSPVASSTITTTTSSSTMSSRQTPISSQYESLTGSDTDPNYESVCYMNKSTLNPYERLQPDLSDPQLSSASIDEAISATASPSVPVSTTEGTDGYFQV